MRVGECVIGVINVESTQLNAYSERDQQVLETVAGQMAMAIQNAQLFARLQQYASEQEEYVSDRTAVLERVVKRLRWEIGDRQRAKAILEEQNEELAELNAILGAQNEDLKAFGHTVAHDLKNPLAIILGFAEVLKYEYINDDDTLLSQGIQVILDNGMRMASIIDELLFLAEVRQLKEIELERLNMSAIVEEVQKLLRYLITKEGATIVIPPSWPAALGHQMWVQEIWINYISNAIKYGGRPPTVELGADVRSDGMAQFWVCDNGAGIAQEDQDRLFTPFTQLDRVRVEGHGLGLSIVQRIVSKLGGEVGVESEVDQGSRFWFTLPTIQDD
jgi:signal transduction histidine kinase